MLLIGLAQMNGTPPPYAVKIIIPYLKAKEFKTVWCPFDKEESYFVKLLKQSGFEVIHGHIDTGQDFFDYNIDNIPNCDCTVSNPPFSKYDQIAERLFSFEKPFAMVMRFTGLFDSKKRFDVFQDKDFEILVPRGRMAFIRDDGYSKTPAFQSVYVCHDILDRPITFTEMDK